MKNLFLILFFLFGLIACREYDELPVVLENRTYVGQFNRSSPNTKWQASTVTLTFDNNNFTGNSSSIKYPAICKGTYEISGSEIIFTNAYPWTAEFDWTLILGGKFKLSKSGAEIIMTRSYNGSVVDTYRLVKK